MRNLDQYPITKSEIVDCMNKMISECDPDLIGDMRPLLLGRAVEIIEGANTLLGEMSDRLDLKQPHKYIAPYGPAAELLNLCKWK